MRPSATRRPIPKPRLLADAQERARAVLLHARISAAAAELLKLVGSPDDYWLEWEEQNEAIHDEADELAASGAALWGKP